MNRRRLLSAEIDYSRGYEYVDLGLPSGTLWATCNLGGNIPEDEGDTFFLGNFPLESKGAYTEWPLYADPATAKMGKYWRTPSRELWDELMEYCTFSRESGKAYMDLTSKTNRNSIRIWIRKGINLPTWYWSRTFTSWGTDLGSWCFFGYSYDEMTTTVYRPANGDYNFHIRPVLTPPPSKLKKIFIFVSNLIKKGGWV